MFKNNNYTFIQINEIRSIESLVFYLWIFLYIPVIFIVLFSGSLYFSLRVKKGVYFFDRPQIDLIFGDITLNNNYCKMTFEFQTSLSLVIFK